LNDGQIGPGIGWLMAHSMYSIAASSRADVLRGGCAVHWRFTTADAVLGRRGAGAPFDGPPSLAAIGTSASHWERERATAAAVAVAALVGNRAWRRPRIRLGHSSGELRWGQVWREAAAKPADAVGNSEPDPWALLGLERGAAVAAVRQAYRAAVRGGAHPDVGGNPEEFRRLRRAYSAALAAAEGRQAPLRQPARPTATATRPATEPAGQRPRPAPTLDDFLRWRREQQPRHDAHRKVRREMQCEAHREAWHATVKSHKKRSHARGHDSSGRGLAARDRQRHIQRIIEKTTVPEAAEAWQRELAMDGFAHDKAGASRKGAASDAPHRVSDPVVGHRMVRAGIGEVKVAVLQAADGARYYVSPLTSRRVPVPCR